MEQSNEKQTNLISLVIPVFNEENSIDSVINEIKTTAADYLHEIIIVNDASTDKTASVIEKHKDVVLINHPYNKGYGAALKTGIRQATGSHIITMDADGQHNPADIVRLIEHVDSYDMVVGARSGGENQEWIRKPGKLVLRLVSNYLVGMKIPDINSGLRLVKKKHITEFKHILPKGFSFSTTITLAMIKGGYNVHFVPITIRRRQAGKSAARQGRDGVITLLLITRCISLFNPLKIYAPAALVLSTISIAYALWNMIFLSGFPKAAIVGFLTGVLLLFFGILADQISLLRLGGD